MNNTIEQKRDHLLRSVKISDKEPNIEYRRGYIDGVLDMFNEAKKINTDNGLSLIEKDKICQ